MTLWTKEICKYTKNILLLLKENSWNQRTRKKRKKNHCVDDAMQEVPKIKLLDKVQKKMYSAGAYKKTQRLAKQRPR